MHIICRDILSVNEVLESETYQGIPLVFHGAKPNAKVQDLLAKLVDSMENRFPYTDIVEAILEMVNFLLALDSLIIVFLFYFFPDINSSLVLVDVPVYLVYDIHQFHLIRVCQILTYIYL